MRTFVVYDATGLILRSGVCALADMDLQAGAGELVMEGLANDTLEYVVDGAIVQRPPMPVLVSATTVPANGVSVVSFTGIPAGALMRVNGPARDAFTVDDGVADLTFDAPGTYQIDIDLFPYIYLEETIDAT